MNDKHMITDEEFNNINDLEN